MKKSANLFPIIKTKTESAAGPDALPAETGVIEVDARGLEPPEPMLRILTALEALPVGGVLRARTERRPIHLLPELDARGVRHESTEQTDGTWSTLLRRA